MNASGVVTANYTALAQLRFIPTTPCRIADTRGANGTFGGPILPAQTARDFPIPQGNCNIPSNAAAYSLNVTVVPEEPLIYLTAWPAGTPQPNASVLNSFEVPQDDILHPQLTVREALYYTAKLRTDLRDSEIDQRIKQVLQDLGIEDIEDREIGSPEKKIISGGQRKRVNIAMELLSDPSVLFLDEPTSALSSHHAFQVMQLLRAMADSGKTIITTIHQPGLDIFKQFDFLIMMGRDKGNTPGAMVYFGPAFPESIEFFNPTKKAGNATPELLMSGLAEQPVAHWTKKYEQVILPKAFCRVPQREGSFRQASCQQAEARVWLRTMAGSFRKKCANPYARPRSNAHPPGPSSAIRRVAGVAFGRVDDAKFTDAAAWAAFCGKIGSIHFLMVVAAVWFECNNASRDIVGETAIFMRERMVNLKLPSYVFSKMTVLSVICAFQCTCLLAITYFSCHLSGPFLTELAVLVASSLIRAAIGLLISAVSPTTEAAIAFLPLVLLPFILLAGGIKPLHEMPDVAQWIASVCPTRWGYEANFLNEAASRTAQFKNELAENLQRCQATVDQYQARSSPAAGRRAQSQPAPVAQPIAVLSDVSESAFPFSEGRSSLSRSFQILAISFTILLTLILSTLSIKAGK